MWTTIRPKGRYGIRRKGERISEFHNSRDYREDDRRENEADVKERLDAALRMLIIE